MENRVKKFSLHVHRKELGRKFKRLRKKKAFWIMAAIMAVLLLAMAAGLIIRAKGRTRWTARP